MTVYVDNVKIPFGRMKMSHMIADTVNELHAMADAIGLKRAWFQGHTKLPHYDVSLSMRQAALKHGAQEISPRDFVMRMREVRRNG